MKPALKFFAGLWTLCGYPEPGREWSLAEKFAEVKRQGFDAIGGRFVPEAPELCAAHGLDYILYLDADGSDYADELRRAVAWRPRRVNVQLCDHDTPPEEAARVWIAMEALARDLGLAIDLELHRDTATETPEKAFAIADLFRAATGRIARFCLDFSHFAVTKHLMPPFAPRLLARPEVIAGARQIHLRPFNGHHAQVPATDGRGQLTPEFRDYLVFVEELFALIQSNAGADEVVYACPENGPPTPGGYALSCFPDVWQDAIRVRDETRRRWAQ
ncbi:MAG: xylose isomerase [Opitutus sp.]|nr:xylose isomerase [Opitutus sp.]